MVVFTGFIEKTYANVPKTGGFDFRGIIVAYLILAFVMARMYLKRYSGGIPIVEGLYFGLAVGILVHLSIAFEMWAMMDVTLAGVIGDRIFHKIDATAGGAVIGLIFGEINTGT